MDINISDFSISSEGSFFIVVPATDAGKAWFLENTEGKLLECCEGFAVECRYIWDLCCRIVKAGFSAEMDGSAISIDRDGDLVLE